MHDLKQAPRRRLRVSFIQHRRAPATTFDSIRMPQGRRHFGQAFNLRSVGAGPWLLLILTIAGVPPSVAAGHPSFRDEMDAAAPVLQLVDSPGFRVIEQYIDRDSKTMSGGFEVVCLEGPPGESAQLTFPLPSALLIAELQYSVRVRCNRPGVQIAARVSLPRSLCPGTGSPYQLLLRGSNISRGLPSETLRLENLPKLLERQARVLRLQSSDSIDVREAYVTDLVFLVPGGTGRTELSVDRIDVYGMVETRIDPHVKLASSEEQSKATYLPQVDGEGGTSVPQEITVKNRDSVRRIVQWQGEAFETLARIGFNVVSMPRPPTQIELREATKAGIELFCPPPDSDALARDGISAEWDCVMAWDLGQILAQDDIEHVARLEQLIERHDAHDSRPTVMTCGQTFRDASRVTDALMLSRELLGSDLTLRDYVTWLNQQQRIVRPGTPLWVTVESELSAARTEQIAALGTPIDNFSLCASYEQLCSLTTAAMSVRCRNYLFTSQSSLERMNDATLQRVRTLELINLRLRMLSPWLATGKITGVGHCSEPGLSAIVFQAERSHLLIPINWSRNFRSQQSLHAVGNVTFIVPGVSETTDAYLLTLAGTKRLRHERTTGGLRIHVDVLPADGMIMLTSDAQAFSQVSQFVRQTASRAARLHRDCAAYRLDELMRAAGDAAGTLESDDGLSAELRRAQQLLRACDGDLEAGYVELAYQRTNEVQRNLFRAEYLLRNVNAGVIGLATPLAFHIGTVAAERGLLSTIGAGIAGPSTVDGGDFEDLTALLQAGWRHQQLSLSGITSSVRLSPESSYDGNYCLELEAVGSDPNFPITVVPTPPVWITSPPIAVRQNELVEITGMARVPEVLIGTVDGLQIIDSIGGRGMATRIVLAPSWQPFRVVRVAPSDTSLTVSVALSGIGRAYVDSFRVRTLSNRPTAQRSATIGR